MYNSEKEYTRQRLAVWPRLASNSWSSYFNLLSRVCVCVCKDFKASICGNFVSDSLYQETVWK